MKHSYSGKALAILLCLAMVFCYMPLVASADTFTDTQNHWGQSYIDEWSGYDVIKGNPDGSFGPDDLMTRGQAASAFAELFNLPMPATVISHPDVPAGSWLVDPVAKVENAKIMQGVGGGLINPNGFIKREDFFLMLGRGLGIREQATTGGAPADGSAYSTGMINALTDKGFVKGDGTGVNALANINRASVMALFSQTITTYANKPGQTVNAEGKGVVLVVADDVTVKGEAGLVVVGNTDGSKGVTLDGVKADQLSVVGGAEVAMAGDTKVDAVVITESAEGSDLTVGANATTGTIESAADNAAIVNNGTVTGAIATTGANADVTNKGSAGSIETAGAGSDVKNTGSVSGDVTAAGAVDNTGKVEGKVTDNTAAGTATPGTTETTETTGGSTGGSSHHHSGTVTPVELLGVSISDTTPAFDDTLTAVIGPADATNVKYQWSRSDTEDGVYTDIAGATSARYKVVAADIGKYLKVTATGENSSTFFAKTSYAVAKAENDLTVTSQRTLYLVSATDDSAHTSQINVTGGNGGTITYTVPTTDPNYATWVSVSESGLVTGKAATSETVGVIISQAATETVKAATLYVDVNVVASAVPLSAVNISGTIEQGQRLTADHVTNVTGTITYQWFISSNGTDYTAISGETSQAYVIKDTDAGKTIKVKASQNGGTPVESAATSVVPYTVALAGTYSQATVTLSANNVAPGATATVTITNVNSAYAIKSVKQGTTVLTGTEDPAGTFTYTTGEINANTVITVEFIPTVSASNISTAASKSIDVTEGYTTGNTVNLAATAVSGISFGYAETADTSDAFTIAGSVVTLTTGATAGTYTGTFTITATGDGNTYGGTATKDVTVTATVSAAAPTKAVITVTSDRVTIDGVAKTLSGSAAAGYTLNYERAYGDTNDVISVAATSTGAEPTFAWSGTAGATGTENTATITANGTYICTISSAAGNGRTAADDVTITITVTEAAAPTPVATKLAITTAPVLGTTAGGDTLSTQPVITVQDSESATVTGSTATVTATLTGTNAANCTLGGTTSVNATAGVATFTNLSITTTQTTDQTVTLTFTSGGLTSAVSETITVKAAAAAPVASATVGDVTISGQVGLAMTPQDVTITLTNATFQNLPSGTTMPRVHWLSNLPAGLEAAIKTTVAAGATTAVFTISGTPTAASTEVMAFKSTAISTDHVQGTVAVPVTSNPNAKFNITVPGYTIDNTGAEAVEIAASGSETTLTNVILKNDGTAFASKDNSVLRGLLVDGGTTGIEEITTATDENGQLKLTVTYSTLAEGTAKVTLLDKTLTLTVTTAGGNKIAYSSCVDATDEDKALADANSLKQSLLTAVSGNGSYIVPSDYRTEKTAWCGSTISAPVRNVASTRWEYDGATAKFTVASAENTETATAVWTVTKGSVTKTVTLTLTGTNGAATFNLPVDVTIV